MVQVELEEASHNLAELIARVAVGEEIIITQGGKRSDAKKWHRPNPVSVSI